MEERHRGDLTAVVADVGVFGDGRLCPAGSVSNRQRNLASLIAGRELNRVIPMTDRRAIMNRLTEILCPCGAIVLVLFAALRLPLLAQSQELESLIMTAKGHGKISSVIDEQEITSALVVLRQDGTVLITVSADLQLLAEGTWKASPSSPQHIVLKITGGAVKGEVIGSGKLLLTNDRKSIRELAIDLRLADGQDISVAFAADASASSK